MDTLKEIQDAYDAWIVEHPETIGDMRKTTKWLAFFLSGRVSTARKLYKIIDHVMKDYYSQNLGLPHDSQDLLKPPSEGMSRRSSYDFNQEEKYTWEYIKNVCEDWILEHPKAIDDLKKILIILARALAGAGFTKAVLFQLIYHFMLDYNNRVIKRASDAKKNSVYPLQSKL